MLELSHLPKINACLNGLSAVFLTMGFIFIKRKKISAHRTCMTGAFVVSTLFLASYLYYHFHAGATRFMGQGWVRPVYFSILISHTILAVVVVPLILTTLAFAIRGQFDRHARLARWTWPIWMYVSLTGILVYVILYHLFPPL